MNTPKPHVPTSDAAPDPITVDRTAAADLLTQLQQDREVNADRIMAPQWYYALNGLLGIIMCLTLNDIMLDLLSDLGFHTDSGGSQTDMLFPASGTMAWILLAVATYVGFQVNDWRKRQIGSDFDTLGGVIAPRNATMWVMAIAMYVFAFLGLAAILLGGLGLQWLPNQTSVIALAMGALSWFGEYGYDRYFVQLVRSGNHDA